MFAGEIEVFIQEYGLPSHHAVLCPPHTPNDLVANIDLAARRLLQDAHPRTITIVTWGHGNRVLEKQGYYKVFSESGTNFELFMLDDLLDEISKLSERLEVDMQVLMTQCWAHCHNQRRFENLRRLRVGWLTDDSKPETSARRWNSLISGEEMSQRDLESFITSEDNYENLHDVTVKKYTSVERRIFLKYLHYSSIHIEAMCYLVRQRSYT